MNNVEVENKNKAEAGEKEITLNKKINQIGILYEAAEMYDAYARANYERAIKCEQKAKNATPKNKFKLLTKAFEFVHKAHEQIQGAHYIYLSAIELCNVSELSGRKTNAEIRCENTEELVKEYKQKRADILIKASML